MMTRLIHKSLSIVLLLMLAISPSTLAEGPNFPFAPQLSWDEPEDWGDGDVRDSYQIYVGPSSSLETPLTSVPYDGGEQSYRLEGLADGQYYATVDAVALKDGSRLVGPQAQVLPFTIGEVVGPVSSTVKYNFQPNNEPVPEGYLKANGGPYVGGPGYGWDRPVDERLRSNSNNIIHQTLIGYKGSGMAQWKVDVPNGAYLVTIGVIDPQFSQGRQRIALEGVVVIDRSSLPVGQLHELSGRLVMVNDGSIEIDLIPENGRHVVMNYVEITPTDEPNQLTSPTNYRIEE